MRPELPASYQQILEFLERYGLLLLADARLPSVANLVVGELLHRSWWGHPRGKEIYEIASRLAAHPQALMAKLVSGKETYVHARLWTALLGVGTAREPWQLRDLSPLASFLLETLARESVLRIDHMQSSTGLPGKALAQAAREVERRLLTYGESIHTASGAHVKQLESWERWMQRAGFTEQPLAPEKGKRVLEDALLILNHQFDARGRLPWLATVL